jgi:predicted esterase YcpF (UPF0227 family)
MRSRRWKRAPEAVQTIDGFGVSPGAQRAPPRLIYLHGFRSSPSSYKARLLGQHMTRLGRANDFFCPQLPASPAQAVAEVSRKFGLRPQDTLVGSSLGGYYATWLAERHGCRCVLLNPAIHPARDLGAYIGEQPMYHSDERFVFEASYIDELLALEIAEISMPERYLLVAAKGDELLDWREMVARYPGAQHIVLEGGDHGLSDFEPLIGQVLRFAGVMD